MIKKILLKLGSLMKDIMELLQVLNKIEMSKKIGEDKVYEFRRSWDVNQNL